MSHPIVQNTLLKCDKGTTETPIQITSQTFSLINGKLKATEEDKQANTNIIPFGVCKLKPTSGGYLPCIPALIKWQNTSPFSIEGKKKLITDSFCKCSTGGTVTPIVDSNSNFVTLLKKTEEDKPMAESQNKANETGEPGYIVIMSGETYQGGRVRKYKYSKGILYEEVEEFSLNDQKYRTTAYTGNINEKVKKIKEDLDLLAANSEGKKLLDWFEKEKNLVTIMLPQKIQKNGMQTANNEKIQYNGLPTNLPAQGTFIGIEMPSFIILGHEMGHVMSYYLKQQDTRMWIPDRTVMVDEIFASHIENKIRKAAGIPLRDFYERDKAGETQLIDLEHYSLYINKQENNYPSLTPERLPKKEAYNYDSIQKDK